MSYSWDGRGSVASELAGSGVSSWSYSATGAIWSGTTSDLPRYGWDAEEASGATGLVYLRARYLSVSEGVFTGRDLHLGSAANPATLNRYAYALSDPVNLYDPLGLASWLSRVTSRVSSAVKPPISRASAAVSQAHSSAMSRFQAAVGAVRQATGSTASATRRPAYAAKVAGYAEHVSAELIERYCGTAAYLAKSAPLPTGPLRAIGSAAAALAGGASGALASASPSDVGHGVLDLLGFIPGVGFVADLANAAWYLAEGDYANAGLSAFSAIPGAGDAAGAGKVAFKGATFVGGLASGGARATGGALGRASGARVGTFSTPGIKNAFSELGNGAVEILGRGSTGRTVPQSLNEEIFMKSVRANPLENAKSLLPTTDSRWPGSQGWMKMQRTWIDSDGTAHVIHFNYNTRTGDFDDFKFKD